MIISFLSNGINIDVDIDIDIDITNYEKGQKFFGISVWEKMKCWILTL